METFFTAYTKFLDFKTYYFIKKFSAFPELKDVSPVLESYGMHIDFDKACNIAGVTSPIVKEELLKQIEQNLPKAKVVELAGAGTFFGKTVAR
jgi:hypothetical protein